MSQFGQRILNFDQLENTLKQNRFESIEIVDQNKKTRIITNNKQPEQLKKEIYSFIKTVPQNQIILNINITNNKLTCEPKPFIGSA